MSLDATPLEHLLAVLHLEEVGASQVSLAPGVAGGEGYTSDTTVFVGRSQVMPHGRVFGGQVLAQGLMACGLTIAPEPDGSSRAPHSLHGYFMRPGDDKADIHFVVERLRDGRSFSTRRVHAVQHGAPILTLASSFQRPAPGLDHQDVMPDVAGPAGLTPLADLYAGIDHPGARHIAEARPIEHRHVERDLYAAPAGDRVAAQHVWMRAVGRLPDDPLLHAAVLAYASDYSLLHPVLRRHGLAMTDRALRIASLDHAMWFHRPARADEWLLYAEQSPSAQGGRGLGIGRMFTQEGRLVATVAQEGMVRLKE
ncbi:MAG TPA: acyl-CoA thioesterase II [Dermatophilaceae bacterium]|nr:acyl-CoA thioesterase II [Dermatophilaceae bacterium]